MGIFLKGKNTVRNSLLSGDNHITPIDNTFTINDEDTLILLLHDRSYFYSRFRLRTTISINARVVIINCSGTELYEEMIDDKTYYIGYPYGQEDKALQIAQDKIIEFSGEVIKEGRIELTKS